MSLPSGYKRLEYIQSSGTQYVNSNFKANQDTRVVIDFEYISGDVVFGAYDAAGANGFGLQAASNKWYTYYGKSSAYSSTAVVANIRLVADVNKNVSTLNGAALRTATANTFSGANPLIISGLYNASAPGFLTALKIYSCQIYDNGTLVRDFIPCQTTDGTIGLWDDVNRVFYGNAGTGTFTAGPVVGVATPANFRLSSSSEATATLAWDSVDGATGYKLYRDGDLIDTITDTSYTDAIQPFTPYTYTLTAYNDSGEGDAAELVVFLSPDNPIIWLVTDRTQEDVTARNSKGVYQAVDLNRVGAAVEYLQKRLFASGVLADVSPRTDWTDSMWISAGEAQVYLDNVKTMRAALAMPKGTPTAPDDMEKLTYAEANHIEMFLVILDALLTDMVFAYRHCGVTTCGMGGLIL